MGVAEEQVEPSRIGVVGIERNREEAALVEIRVDGRRYLAGEVQERLVEEAALPDHPHTPRALGYEEATAVAGRRREVDGSL